MAENRLYYGDNLDILRRSLPEASIDLIYLDPPFNSHANYNAFFAYPNGIRRAVPLKAFEDIWTWNEESSRTYHELIAAQDTPPRARRRLIAFRQLFGDNNLLAYLAMMGPRLAELHRVLEMTGSLYLHCDPTASHYLKLTLDAVFGPENFRNEIIWKRTHSHRAAHRVGPIHDSILFYTKSPKYVWTDPKVQHDPVYVAASHFKQKDPVSGRFFQAISLTGAGVRQGESGQPCGEESIRLPYRGIGRYREPSSPD